MSISRADFLRTLLTALGHHRYQIKQNNITVDAEDFRLSLRLLDEGERRIAAMVLPVLNVEFTFEGDSPEQIKRFMVHFDRCFQRGGG